MAGRPSNRNYASPVQILTLALAYPLWGVTKILLGCAAILLGGGCGNGVSLSEASHMAACGYVESESSPYTPMDPDFCALITVTSPDSALLTDEGVDACDVERVGTKSLVVQLGGRFRVWAPVVDSAISVLWHDDPINCD